MNNALLRLAPLALAITLSACGGGGGSTDSSNTSGSGSSSPGTPAVKAVLTVNTLEFAQSHVLPEAGLSWTLTNGSGQLHLVGNRPALMLAALGQSDASNPVIEAWKNGSLLGTLALNAPAQLPPTESSGPAYAANRWSATLPATWIAPGISFTLNADNYTRSSTHTPNVGADSTLNLYVLPFYLFGANDTNTQPFSSTKVPDATTQQEAAQKWPLATLNAVNHPIGRVIWNSLVIAPRNDSSNTAQSAYVVTSMDQQKDGYGVMDSTLSLLHAIRAANGEANTNNQYYAPILAIDTGTGKYHDPSGGLGGGDAGVGDYRYTGIFIHEQGHAYGLPHAGDAYNNGQYPYAGGSLSGSVWGFDANHNQFLSNLVPSTASSYSSCKSGHQLNTQGQCYKQDPMQGGAGDQSPGYKFATFSDFNTGKMQQWFEGTTALDSKNNHTYSGGVIFDDKNSSTGYSRWDGIDNKRVEVAANLTTSNGLYGLNQGLPVQRGVPVYAIAITYSNAGTAGASQIYPPLAYTGNLLQTFDPTSTQDLSDFTVDTGKYPWYCKGSGCDYTVRVTYSDNTKIYRVLKDGFRSWWTPTATPASTTTDPLNGSSFKLWVINLPGSKSISKIELLDTPMVWKGLPASPTVLLSR